MPDHLTCPSCGHVNADGATSCAQCNFPLADPVEAATAGRPAGAGGPGPAPPVRREPDAAVRRPVRRERREPPMTNQQITLWLVFGVLAAAAVIYTAVKANLDRAAGPPVEGSSAEQQRQIDEFRRAVERDSNDVQARVGLGNLYYDTANWSDAIVEYRAAIRRDSSLVHAIVDLGVCYYSLGNSVEAERHFLLGLARDPNQPVALFNLGIVSEKRADYPKAIDYFHQALQRGASPDIQQGVVAAMQRIQEKTGRAPKPLAPGSPAPGTP
jgi:cytochrome c-type biogenesis protein CcmH/NrfG